MKNKVEMLHQYIKKDIFLCAYIVGDVGVYAGQFCPGAGNAPAYHSDKSALTVLCQHQRTTTVTLPEKNEVIKPRRCKTANVTERGWILRRKRHCQSERSSMLRIYIKKINIVDLVKIFV